MDFEAVEQYKYWESTNSTRSLAGIDISLTNFSTKLSNLTSIFVNFCVELLQENIKSMRKTLKVLQKDASDKENLVGRNVNTSAEKSLYKKSKS